MASTDPWTGARLDDDNDSPLGGTFLARLLTDLRTQVTPRFATVAARDAAAAAAGIAGMPLKNGMSCWTDDVGYWDRVGGAWKQRVAGIANAATTSYVDGTSGVLQLIGGWAAYPGYHVPNWYLSSNGWVTLSGRVLRTAADFALGSGPAFQFATLDALLVPTATVGPICYVGLNNPLQSYPGWAHITAGSSSLEVVGMDSGTGTMKQNLGFINLEGVRWHI